MYSWDWESSDYKQQSWCEGERSKTRFSSAKICLKLLLHKVQQVHRNLPFPEYWLHRCHASSKAEKDRRCLNSICLWKVLTSREESKMSKKYMFVKTSNEPRANSTMDVCARAAAGLNLVIHDHAIAAVSIPSLASPPQASSSVNHVPAIASRCFSSISRWALQISFPCIFGEQGTLDLCSGNISVLKRKDKEIRICMEWYAWTSIELAGSLKRPWSHKRKNSVFHSSTWKIWATRD